MYISTFIIDSYRSSYGNRYYYHYRIHDSNPRIDSIRVDLSVDESISGTDRACLGAAIVKGYHFRKLPVPKNLATFYSQYLLAFKSLRGNFNKTLTDDAVIIDRILKGMINYSTVYLPCVRQQIKMLDYSKNFLRRKI